MLTRRADSSGEKCKRANYNFGGSKAMKSFGLTDKGAVRKDNQDSFVIEECRSRNCLVVALCDGMGGAKAGGLASSLSNDVFVSCIFGKLTSRDKRNINYRELLQDACSEANGASFECSMFDEACRGMGTTIVGGVINSDGNGYIINVGDSRAYLISAGKKSIRQITRDHSLVQELIEFGAITKEQARSHPNKNIITRALGSEATVEADYYELSLDKNDVLILCSDGLSNTLEDSELLECALSSSDPETVCRELMSKALARGAKDNVTVVAVAR